MIENLELKLKGREPITREELFILVNSWGRKNCEINTLDGIIIKECVSKECYDLSNLDVSQIDNLSYLFYCSIYNGDLSHWNISNIQYMNMMFGKSKFNNDSLKDWDVSNVEDMDSMFYKSEFNGDISNWDISNCKEMSGMFAYSIFDSDISNWKFNKDSYLINLFNDNTNFKTKYNNCYMIPNYTKDFLIWFENNRENIKEINTPKKEVLDFFSFDNKNIELKD